jgi:hypothetical protein
VAGEVAGTAAARRVGVAILISPIRIDVAESGRVAVRCLQIGLPDHCMRADHILEWMTAGIGYPM